MQVRVATRRPGTDSAGCADFPEGLPSEREGRSISPLASGLPLDKSSGALTLLFFCVCIMQGQGHQRVNREARVGGRPVGCAGLGPRGEALGLSPSHVPRSLFVELGQKAADLRWPVSGPLMQSPKGEGENGY